MNAIILALLVLVSTITATPNHHDTYIHVISDCVDDDSFYCYCDNTGTALFISTRWENSGMKFGNICGTTVIGSNNFKTGQYSRGTPPGWTVDGPFSTFYYKEEDDARDFHCPKYCLNNERIEENKQPATPFSEEEKDRVNKMFSGINVNVKVFGEGSTVGRVQGLDVCSIRINGRCIDDEL